MDSEHLDQLSICDIVYQPIIAPILDKDKNKHQETNSSSSPLNQQKIPTKIVKIQDRAQKKKTLNPSKA